MSILLLKFAPWLAGVVVLLGLGGWIGWELNPYPARYRALQASDAIARAHGEEAVRSVLTAQLTQAQEVTRNNQSAMVTLANENAQTAADRDATLTRLHRLEQLLSAAAARPAAGRVVSQTRDRSSTPVASGDPSADRAGALLIAARDEAKRNASRLNALIAEISPQL